MPPDLRTSAVQPRPRLNDVRLDEQLERDGYVVAPMLDPEDVVRLRSFFDGLDSDVHHQAFGSSLQSHDLPYRQAVDRELKAVFEKHTGRLWNGYRVCFANFTLKQPRNALGEMPFHQDPTFVDEGRYQSLGLWCPLVDVDVSNGCLCAVPGSHRLNRGPRGPFTSFPYEELVPLIRERYLRPVPMKAGEAFIFCQKVFHTSPPNGSDAMRPVATALLAPHGVPLRFYHQRGEVMEVYDVDDLFYTRHILGTEPEDARLIGTTPYTYEPLTAERLAG